MRALTKSSYLVGLECPRYPWVVFNQPEKIRRTTIAEEFKFKEGDKVGQMAKKLFPEGINLPTDHKENIRETKEALKKKNPYLKQDLSLTTVFQGRIFWFL